MVRRATPRMKYFPFLKGFSDLKTLMDYLAHPEKVVKFCFPIQNAFHLCWLRFD